MPKKKQESTWKQSESLTLENCNISLYPHCSRAKKTSVATIPILENFSRVPVWAIREIIDFSRCRRENKQSLNFFFALGLRILQEALRWIWFAPNPLYFFILVPLALSRVLYFEVWWLKHNWRVNERFCFKHKMLSPVRLLRGFNFCCSLYLGRINYATLGLCQLELHESDSFSAINFLFTT